MYDYEEDDSTERFRVRKLLTDSYGLCGDQDVVGFTVYDYRLKEAVELCEADICFSQRDHAEIFARVMNFGDKLKD